MDEIQENVNTSEDVITILIATDNHLGYMERDPLRSNDSFQTFEEILLYAKKYNVDMMLLGGDLFHDNKPSRKTLYNTIALLRQHCMGDKPCQLEFLSDQKKNFSSFFPIVNYEDPNLNISLPIFSIHGNHDDPAGDGNLCALDVLSASGLVNYFGKSSQVDNIEISPILLKKGNTRLALYGLGNIRDERLYRTFLRKNVRMLRPKQNQDEWFNLFVLHQNRVSHNPKNYIPETFINDFMDLILWGHEHECIIDLSKNEVKNFYITQPGSSIATSLCEGESKTKHIGILRIKQKQFELEKIKLKSVRPFLMEDVCLQKDLNNERNPSVVTKYLIQKVEELEKKAIEEWKENNPELNTKMKCPRPLIRLRVEYSGGYPTFNPHKFGQRFISRVANPNDILHFYRKKTISKPNSSSGNDVTFLPDQLENTKIETLIDEYLQIKNLEILNEKELGNAVKTCIEKDEKDAIKKYVDKYLVDICKEVKEKYKISDVELLNEQIQSVKNIKKEKYNAMDNSLNIFSNFTNKNKDETDEENESENENKSPKTTKKKTRKRSRSKSAQDEDNDDEDNDDDDDDSYKIDDEENDIIEEITKTKVKRRSNRKKNAQNIEEEDDDIIEIDNDIKEVEKSAPKRKTRRKTTKKIEEEDEEDDDNNENNETYKIDDKVEKRTRKTGTRKTSTKKSRKKDNDDIEIEDKTITKKRGRKKSTKKNEEEEEEDNDDDMSFKLDEDNDEIIDSNSNKVIELNDEIEDSENSKGSDKTKKIKKEPKTPRKTKKQQELIMSMTLDEPNTVVYNSNITNLDTNSIKDNNLKVETEVETKTPKSRRTRKLPISFDQSASKTTRPSKRIKTKELHQSQLDFSKMPKK